jgi:hypothetical protein
MASIDEVTRLIETVRLTRDMVSYRYDPSLPPRAVVSPGETISSRTRTKAGSHRWPDQRIPPGRVTWMRFSAPTGGYEGRACRRKRAIGVLT